MSDERITAENEDEHAVSEEGATAEADVPPFSDDTGASSEVDAVTAERDAYRETLQHLQADFENYRKRVLKQQSEIGARAQETLVEKLLPVLDTIDLARAHDPSGSLDQVASALVEVLTKEGLERIAAVDEPFDPTHHDAVAHEEGDGGPRVSEELRGGYRWKGRVIRPAMVKVVG